MESINQFRVAALPRAGSDSIFEGRPQTAGAPPTLTPGASVEAKVVGRFEPDGLVLDIDGHLFQSRVPDAGQRATGERLPLVVLRGGDIPTFLLSRTAAGDGGTPSTLVELSSLASRLGSVLAAVQSGTTADTGPDAASALPLVALPPTDDASVLAQPLRQAIEGSGLFYESHLVDWVAGKRPTEAIRTEPQAILSTDDTDAAVPSVKTTTVLIQPVATDEAPALGVMAPQVAHLVDRQLQTLAGQPVTWSGWAWPGQWLDWTIEEDAADDARQDGGGEAGGAWTSKLRLTLPELGVVELRVGLQDDRLAVRVVSTAAATEAFRQGSEALRAALAARGLTLTGLQVNAGDDVA